MPGSLSHLAARFVDVLLARPLRRSEVEAVVHWLEPALAAIFFDQPAEDQRHGYHAALVVVGNGSYSPEMVEAALLHDVGKRHAHLGIVSRSLASMMIRLGLPLPPRMTVYRDHGLAAARELANAGASRLSVEFAATHHGAKPPGIDTSTWTLLLEADQPPNAQSLVNAGITSFIK